MSMVSLLVESAAVAQDGGPAGRRASTMSIVSDQVVHNRSRSLLCPPRSRPTPDRGRYCEPMSEGEAGLRLQEQLCFAAYTASRALTGRYRTGLDEIGLTYSQYLVMMALWEHGPVTMGFLCQELHLDSGTLSPLLRRLEALGRLTRHRRPADERTVEVAPTAEGM